MVIYPYRAVSVHEIEYVGPSAGALLQDGVALWKAGKLPAPAEQLATGTVIIHAAPANEPAGVAVYARVSSADQKADLDRQLSRLAEFSAAHGFRVVEAARETGSGLNGRRKALL